MCQAVPYRPSQLSAGPIGEFEIARPRILVALLKAAARGLQYCLTLPSIGCGGWPTSRSGRRLAGARLAITSPAMTGEVNHCEGWYDRFSHAKSKLIGGRSNRGA